MSINMVKPALRIALCEDNPVDTELLSALVEASGTPHTLDAFLSGEAFLEVFEKEKYDLVFLDVYMGELSGVQVAEKIRETDTEVVIIFTTSSEDYTREGYRLNAYKYLLKPLDLKGIADALELGTLKRDKVQDETLAFVADEGPVVIPLGDIIFIESFNRRLSVHTVNETYASNMTINDLAKLLPSSRFLRSHRAYIVNLDHVDELREDFIMDNGEIAYVTVKNHSKIQRAYKKYLARETPKYSRPPRHCEERASATRQSSPSLRGARERDAAI